MILKAYLFVIIEGIKAQTQKRRVFQTKTVSSTQVSSLITATYVGLLRVTIQPILPLNERSKTFLDFGSQILTNQMKSLTPSSSPTHSVTFPTKNSVTLTFYSANIEPRASRKITFETGVLQQFFSMILMARLCKAYCDLISPSLLFSHSWQNLSLIFFRLYSLLLAHCYKILAPYQLDCKRTASSTAAGKSKFLLIFYRMQRANLERMSSFQWVWAHLWMAFLTKSPPHLNINCRTLLPDFFCINWERKGFTLSKQALAFQALYS